MWSSEYGRIISEYIYIAATGNIDYITRNTYYKCLRNVSILCEIISRAFTNSCESSSRGGYMLAQWAVPSMKMAVVNKFTDFSILRACHGSMEPLGNIILCVSLLIFLPP